MRNIFLTLFAFVCLLVRIQIVPPCIVGTSESISRRRDCYNSHALKMNSLFFEVLMAPGFDEDALVILKSKKNRVLLLMKDFEVPAYSIRSVLNGTLVQASDQKTESIPASKLSRKIIPMLAISLMSSTSVTQARPWGPIIPQSKI